MTVSPFDSKIQGGLFSDPELSPLFSDEVVISAMVDVEVGLAKVQGELGIIPASAAHAIAKAANSFIPDFEVIAASTEVTGVATITLVQQLRDAAGDAGGYVHWGATSQDIIDTALVLRLQKALKVIVHRLGVTCSELANLANENRHTVMLGRTRSQQAMPTTFGLKAAGWLDALLNANQALNEFSPQLLRVQLGGGVGTLAALGDQGISVVDGLASELGLQTSELPWHTNRTSMAAFAGHLSIITGTLGKIGQDIVLLAQTEVGELTLAGGGGSSTMPQKVNPIAAETLVSLARMNAGLIGNMHQALIQEHERGGPGWQLEDLSLPQMVVACGAALRHAGKILGGMNVNSERMQINLNASNGLILAEAAIFALSEHMDRASAGALVKEAVSEVVASGDHLIEILKSKSDTAIDWAYLADPKHYLGSNEVLINRALERLNKFKNRHI